MGLGHAAPDERPDRLRPCAEAILYPLWDAGLAVGHQVRTPKDQLRAMRNDMKTRTAALTGRFVAGDEAWATKWLTTWAADSKRRARSQIAELLERPRPGSPWSLDPDLKNAAGGRRDFDELTWIAATLSATPASDPTPLVTLELLSAEEYELLAGSADVVVAARWLLQREGFGDVLDAEAESLFSDHAEGVQRALGDTAVILDRVRGRVLRHPKPGPSEGAPLTPDEVFGALDAADEGLTDLELAAHAGRLDDLLPEFSRLMSARRPGLGHRFTVGAHCLRAASLVGQAGDDPALVRSLSTLGDLRLVRVAALVHDVGKLEGGSGHAERGAAPAAKAAAAFGLGEREAHDASELVRLHLTLVDTALRDDLDDEDAILRCAARVGDRMLIAPLHALTVADSRATGAATWTAWTASLVTTLVARLDTALGDEVDGAGLVAAGERVRERSLALLGTSLDAERAFVEAAPLRYLATHEPDDVVRDVRLVSALIQSGGGDQVRTAVSAGPVPGTTAVTVAAVDRPGLLSRIAGAMALSGLDILSVDVYGTTGRIALDRFVVQAATRRALTPETFATFDRLVTVALADRLELAVRLAQRRRHYPARASTPGSVEVDQGGWDTTVHVRAADRPGLLHDLAAAVAATGLDIRWARVHTVDGVASDTFHVIGPDGGPVSDPGTLGHLSMRLRDAL